MMLMYFSEMVTYEGVTYLYDRAYVKYKEADKLIGIMTMKLY